MGSLVAYLARTGTPEVGTVESMIRAAPHRGSHTDQLVLGRCALAVSHSSRPDVSLASGGGLAAAFCGVLDNLTELTMELHLDSADAPGPGSPAEVLLAAYRAFGEQAPAHFRGYFSAALTDGFKLVCFRDHLGFGTLFYRRDAGGCYVATEAKQVVAGAGIAREPDLDVLPRLFFQTYDDQTPCALKGVERLPKTTVAVFDAAGGRLRRYWDATSFLESARFSEAEIQERFDELMNQAVARTLTGEDVISLSGGIDSPAIAAYAAPLHFDLAGRPLTAASIVYPNLPSVDERRYVELVADKLDLDLHTYELKSKPLDGMQEWVDIADGPVPAVVLSQYEEHYRFIRGLGLTNNLSGEVAELVFDMSRYLIPHLLVKGRLRALTGHLRARRSRGASVVSIARQLMPPFVPTRITAARWGRQRVGVPAWLDRRKVNEPAVRSIVPAGQRWRKVQVGAFTVPGISMEADDICQELCGVRTRRPWADVDLWEFFLSLPAEVKFPDTRSKTLVRRLLRGKVPDEILDRTDKTMFDDSIMANIDYPVLRHWLIDPSHRIEGVDYEALQERLDHQNMELVDFEWAKDLAGIHAFLSLW
jgi:asparagine synthase (glutamine-hydrolysing)